MLVIITWKISTDNLFRGWKHPPSLRVPPQGRYYRLRYQSARATCGRKKEQRLRLVTWLVSWSSAHPPDLLLFTNQHTIYKSRMTSPAWSIQVFLNSYMNMCLPPHMWSCLLAYVLWICLSNCVRSKNRPADRLGCNLLTPELTSR